MLNSLTNAAIHQHAALHNLPPGTAEEHFITTCQHLEGYGIEQFAAHDHQDNEIVLGISLTGISVMHMDNRPSRYYGYTVQYSKHTLFILCFLLIFFIDGWTLVM